jgi:glycosyltransferase involved in cell wall biosynthesis
MSKDLPLVSVVINSFNQAAYLEETILSVLKQDYPRMEVLLVDGGSSDGSLEIIQRYAEKFTWWVSEKDSGQAEGINKGFQHASGSLVAWLNSDDYYLPGAVSRAAAKFQQSPDAVLIYGDVMAVDGQGQPIHQMRTGDWQLADLMEFHILNQPAVFINGDILRKTGGLDLGYHYLLDHQLWLRLATHGRMVHVTENWAAGRFHAAAKNVAAAARFGEEAYRIADWLHGTAPYDVIGRGRWQRVQAGAHRLNARYLLDGGQPRQALAAYLKGLREYAPLVLPEWHRMLYGLLSLAGLAGLKRLYLQLRGMLQPAKLK